MAKKSSFYKIYFSLIAVFLVALTVGLILLNDVLKEYEAARPETVANGIFTEYIEKGNIYGLANICELNVSKFETADSVNGYFAEKTKDKKLDFKKSGSSVQSDEETYSVKADDETVMTVVFDKTGKKGKYGFKKYSIKKAAFRKANLKSVTVNAPAGAKVSVNGKPCDVECDSEALPDFLKALNGSDKFRLLNTYTISGLLSSDVELTATDESGKLSVIKNGSSYSVVANADAARETEVMQFALDAAHAYAAYMQEDGGLAEVAKYCDTSTDFYKSVRKTPTQFVMDHSGFRFDNDTTSDYYEYDQNTYRCRVRFTQVLLSGSKTYTDQFDKYVYLVKTDSGLKVINIQAAI